MKVLILHTLPPKVCAADRREWEFDLQYTVEGLAGALPEAVTAAGYGEPAEIAGLIHYHKPDVVFNLCEAPLGRPDLEAHAAALFEWMGVRFTGSSSQTLALCRRKDHTNAVLAAHGVPVPRTGVFPCIVKPADEDGSAGVHADSVCEHAAAMERALARLPGPVVVQEFLPGREFSVTLWGRHEPEFVAIAEMTYLNGLRLVTYESKWDLWGEDFAKTVHYGLDLDPALRDGIVSAARGAWRATGVRGYGRVDMRQDDRGEVRVMDVNPNPDIGPSSGTHRALGEAGWTWEEFVRKQVEWA